MRAGGCQRGGGHVTPARRADSVALSPGGAARPSGRPAHLRHFPPPLGAGSGPPRWRSELFVIPRSGFGTLRLPSVAPVVSARRSVLSGGARRPRRKGAGAGGAGGRCCGLATYARRPARDGGLRRPQL